MTLRLPLRIVPHAESFGIVDALGVNVAWFYWSDTPERHKLPLKRMSRSAVRRRTAQMPDQMMGVLGRFVSSDLFVPPRVREGATEGERRGRQPRPQKRVTASAGVEAPAEARTIEVNRYPDWTATKSDSPAG